MKIVTAQQIVDAIRQNGLPKSKGWFFKYQEGIYLEESNHLRLKQEPVAACAWGQAYINLRIDPDLIVERGGYKTPEHSRFATQIVHFNDDTDLSFQEIANNLEKSQDYDPNLEFAFFDNLDEKVKWTMAYDSGKIDYHGNRVNSYSLENRG